MSPAGPLHGIRVLDLSRILSGPYATMVLADLGADVVKVEDTKDGDDTRQWGPPFQGDDAAYFLAVNRNKRGIGVDLKNPEGRELVLRLVDRSDVVVENFRPGTAARLGLGYEDVAARNPRIVYASISGYGQTGPWAARPGYDAVAQAESGMMSVCGDVDGPPVRPGVATADIGAGMWATIGILAALQERDRTGRGQQVDVSLLEGQLSWLTYVAGGWFASGVTPRPHGSAHPTIVPYQAFSAADGYVMVACGNDRLWRRFAALLGDPDLADDARYATNPDRVAARDELVDRIGRSFCLRPREHWLRALDEAGIPASPIADVAEALTSPQALARGMVQEVEHPTAGRLRTVATPIHLSRTPASVRTPPPEHGQHTDDVLRELGYDLARIEDLHAGGAVR